MEAQIKVSQYQEVPAADFTRLQGYVAQTFDDLVRLGIDPGQAYADLAVVKSGAFEVQVGTGAYFAAGAMYPQASVITQSLIDHQPLANAVKVAVIAWGAEGDTDPQYRDFMVNLETEEVEARLVDVTRARTCSIAFVRGVESGDPQLPSIPVDRLLVATITLSPTGIDEIVMSTAGSLASLRALASRMISLETWKSLAEPRISTIGSDVANLANRVGRAADTTALISLAADVARLKEVAGLPDDYAAYGADRFLDTDETDVTDPTLLAKVEEGVRFADEAANITALQVFNPINSAVSQSGGVLLPAYSSVRRMLIDGYAGELSLSQYSQIDHQIRRKMISRKRIRWGQSKKVCTNSAWWGSGNYDPATGIFTRAGETWLVDVNDRTDALINHRGVRLRQFWTDTYKKPYWTYVDVKTTIAGAQVAQTFLNTQDGWLTGIDLWFTKRGSSGNVHITICGVTASGTPDLADAVYQGEIAYLSIKTLAWTAVALTPTYLEAGKRYAVVLTTNGNHYVGMASGAKYLSGTFFNVTDGTYFAGDLTKDMMLGLRFAGFASPRVAVDLQPLSLSGGITDIDLLAGMVVPDATDLTFQVQIAGAWVPLAEVSLDALIGLPPLLPFQAVFQGTPDIMPGLVLSDSQVTVSRPRTTFHHASTDRLLAAPSDTIRVITTFGGWNVERHTATVKIRTADGLVTASVVQDRDLGGDRLERTSLFALGAPVDAFSIEIDGSTTTALDLFLVEERVDIES